MMAFKIGQSVYGIFVLFFKTACGSTTILIKMSMKSKKKKKKKILVAFSLLLLLFILCV